MIDKRSGRHRNWSKLNWSKLNWSKLIWSKVIWSKSMTLNRDLEISSRKGDFSMNRVDWLEVSSKSERKSTRRKVASFPKRVLAKILDRTANLAIFLDVSVGVAAGKVFNLLPKGIQESLRRLNNEYLQHRNRLLNIKFQEEVLSLPYWPHMTQQNKTQQNKIWRCSEAMCPDGFLLYL